VGGGGLGGGRRVLKMKAYANRYEKLQRGILSVPAGGEQGVKPSRGCKVGEEAAVNMGDKSIAEAMRARVERRELGSRCLSGLRYRKRG